jgi:phage terminase large subunit-like protein
MSNGPTVQEKLAALSKEELEVVRWRLRWQTTAREKQLAPDVKKPNWKVWGAMTGRGTGKTLTGANYIGLEAAQTPRSMNAVIAPTHDDTRYVCFEGPTGILRQIPEILIIDHNKNLPSITLWNKSIIRGYVGDVPERLRGPQHHRGWIDEFGSFLYPEDALSNFRFGLRLGPHPRFLWTTTPRPTPALKQLIKETDHLTTGSLYENRANLPDAFIDEILKYEGTKLGRQEIHGELIDIEEMGIVKRSDWQLWPYNKPLPSFSFVLMSLDTAMTEKTVNSKTHDPDFSACSVWGVFEHNGKRCILLLDCWQDRLSLSDLIIRVKDEMKFTYGDTKAPLLRPTYLGKPLIGKSWGRGIDVVLIERQGAGRPLVQMLASENILTHEYNPGKADKLQRLHMVSHAFAHHRVFAVESEKRRGTPKSWADNLITQVCSYAGRGSIKHDDLLDSTTQALKYILDNFTGPLTVPPVRIDIDAETTIRVANPYSQ